MIRKLKMMALAAAMAMMAGNVWAQGCGCSSGTVMNYDGCNSYQGHSQFRWMYGHGRYAANCGRGIGNAQAAALWADYCHDDCSYKGGMGDCGMPCRPGCGLKRSCLSRLGHGGCGLNLRGRFGCQQGNACDDGCNVGNCNFGNFGWPAPCNDGCDNNSCGGLLMGMLSRHGQCGNGCKLFGGFGGGGLFHRNHRCGGCKLGGMFKKLFSGKRGCSGCYFGEYVGSDYGCCDFRSRVRGRITSECGCGTVNTTPMSVNEANSFQTPTEVAPTVDAPAVDYPADK